MFKVSCLAAVLVLMGSAALAHAGEPDRMAAMDKEARERIASFEKVDPKDDYSVRELTYYAHYVLATGEDPAKAEAYIRRAFSLQDMDKNSKDYGTFPWDVQALNHSDPNSVEFTLDSLGPILLRFGDKLSPQLKEEAIEHVRAGLAAVKRHKVLVNYTNIYLMKIENLLLLGEWMKDSQSVSDASGMLDQWLNLCAHSGIHEYASPTYAAVQMNSLTTAYRCTAHAELKPKLKMGLDFLYGEALADYFPGQQQMTGTHSRTYDFLFGSGNVDQWYFALGLRDVPPVRDLFSGCCSAYMNAIEDGYTPSADLLALAHLPHRTVVETWGDQPGEDRYTFITPDFSIGSTSAWYGAQDAQVTVQFPEAQPAPPMLATIAVFSDTWDSPYGKVLRNDKSGHAKPTHLRDGLATVQHEGAILELIDLSPGMQSESLQSVATNVIFPLRADEIILDGKRLDLPQNVRDTLANQSPKAKDNPAIDGWSLPATTASVLGIRQGNAAVAIRMFSADGLANKPSVLALKADGAPWGAGRLVAYHYQGEARMFDRQTGPVGAGVMILARHCESDGEFQAMMKDIRDAQPKSTIAPDGTVWDVSATIGGHTLESALSFKADRPTIRRVDGDDYKPQFFTVNGRDLAAELLGNLSVPQ